MNKEPFNHDRFWRAFFASPDGAVRSEPLIAIVVRDEPGPPQCFVWEHDGVRDVADVPGFVCVMGTKDAHAECEDFVRKHNGPEIEAWLRFFAEASRERTDD